MYKVAVFAKKSHQKKIFNEKYYSRIRKISNLHIYDRDDFEAKQYYLDFIRNADILITSWETPPLSKEILDLCPNLKAVLHAAGSVKPILTDDFIKKGIRISGSAIALGMGVAETALGFAISACKGFFNLSRDTSSGLWNENVRNTVKDFYDITIGIIGGGFAGKHMLCLLKNFNVNALMYDPFLSREQINELGAEKAQLDDLIRRSDVISIHAPAIPDTFKMINAKRLAMIKNGAIIINTARGSIIDEEALISELKKERFFACIDVTYPEPPARNNELRSLKNVILTPHIAGACTNGLKRIALHVCEELERFCNNEKMKTEIIPSKLSEMA